MRPLAMLGAVLLILALGVAAGRWSSDGGAEPAPPPAVPAPPPPDVASAGPPPNGPGDRPSRSAAVAAATRAMASLADAELLSKPARRLDVARRIATPGYAAELARLLDRGYDHMAEQAGARATRGMLLRLLPLAVRVEHWGGRRASVAVWKMVLVGPPEGRVVAAFSTSRAEMVFADGRWLVARFAVDEPGPVPALLAPETPTAPDEFLSLLAGYRGYER